MTKNMISIVDAMVMPISSLQFGVRFAEANLEALDGRGWITLRDDIAAFRSISNFQAFDNKLSGPQAFDRRSGKPHEETKAAIASLQIEVRKIIHGIVNVHEVFAGKRSEANLAQVTLSGSFFLQPSNPPFIDRNDLCMFGSERDVFLFELLNILANEPTNRLQRCPECHRTFVRMGKQRYCCRKCVNRVNARAWRKTPEGKQKNRERVAANYEKRLKAKYPNVKISKKKPRISSKQP